MKTSVEFESELFHPYLPDESQVNPGVYGAELAYWLSRHLAERGVMTSYPNYEDWGWFIEFTSADGDEYWLCCSNTDEDKWRCFLDPKSKGILGRRKAPVEGAQALMHALATLLEGEQGIRNVSWE